MKKFQQNGLLCVVLISITVGCNHQDSTLSPNANPKASNYLDALKSAINDFKNTKEKERFRIVNTNQNEALIVSKLMKDKSFLSMSEALNVMETHIVNGQLRRLITDPNDVKIWKNKLAVAKSKTQVRVLLAQMFSEPQLLINAQEASWQFFNRQNMNSKFPELAAYSRTVQANLVMGIWQIDLNLKNARTSADTQAQCIGRCSSQLNIDMNDAKRSLAIDLLMCDGPLDAVGAMAQYASSFDTALQSFENCFYGC